ncbi:hypothetical protein D3C75_1220250 [compost metagenome]
MQSIQLTEEISGLVHVEDELLALVIGFGDLDAALLDIVKFVGRISFPIQMGTRSQFSLVHDFLDQLEVLWGKDLRIAV